MILSSLFSFAQKPEYQTIYKNVEFYEFNTNKDEIYIYSYKKLCVYDINKQKLSVLDTNVYAETVWLKFPFFLAKTGFIYFVTYKYVYEIKDKKIARKIPIIYEEYRGGMIDFENEKQKMKVFNKLITDYKDNDITKLMDDIYFLNYKDGHSVAFSCSRLRDNDLIEENKEKIVKNVKVIDLDTDTSYISKQTKEGTTNYFENKKIVIKEETYSCRKTSFMSLVSGCKYKINIEYNNKTIKLKDKERRTRYSYVNGKRISEELNRYLPNSKYITDKNGNIYLMFWEDDKHNLIKLPINQFNK